MLFDKEATTFFYNCVFNLMDSLMRFAVLFPPRRASGFTRAREEETEMEKGGRGREGGKREGRKRVEDLARAVVCSHACERV